MGLRNIYLILVKDICKDARGGRKKIMMLRVLWVNFFKAILI